MKKTKTKTKTEAQLAAEREAEAVFASSGLPGVIDAAWAATGDKTRLKAFERVARREPALARSFAIFDWAKNEGFIRDNRQYEQELHVAAYGLATRGDPRILPFIAGLVRRSWIGAHLFEPFIDTDRAPTGHLLACARGWLAHPRAIDEIDVGAAILTRFGDASDSNALAESFDDLVAGVQQAYVDFSTAMARMKSRRTIALVSRALCKHGVPASLVPALHHAIQDDAIRLEEVRGHAALILARTGQGLDIVLRGLGHREPRAGLFTAIATLGAAAPDRRDDLVATLRATKAKHPVSEAARIAALRDLGEAVDVEGAVAAALASDREKDDADAFPCRVTALDMVRARTDVRADLATPFVLSNDPFVHRAAVRALRTRRERVPDFRLYDPLSVLELKERGPAALADALVDTRGLFRDHIVLALGDSPDAALRAPLETFARELAAAPLIDGLSDSLRWTVAALARVGGAEELFEELLAKGGEHASAVIDNASLVSRGIERGMVKALASDNRWTKRAAAEWLRKHPSEEATRALAERGLAPEDLTLLSR